jgi:hypothetical protein
MRRGGIVALARRLLIALWRYLEQGWIPEGARFIRATVKRASLYADRGEGTYVEAWSKRPGFSWAAHQTRAS